MHFQFFLQVFIKISTPALTEVQEIEGTTRGKRGFGSSGLSEEIEYKKFGKYHEM